MLVLSHGHGCSSYNHPCYITAFRHMAHLIRVGYPYPPPPVGLAVFHNYAMPPIARILVGKAAEENKIKNISFRTCFTLAGVAPVKNNYRQ